MDTERTPPALIHWSTVLAAGGVLVFGVAAFFLAVALWHRALTHGGGPTYVVISPALAACFIVGSIVVLVASAFVLHMAGHRRIAAARLRALAGIIGTIAGWLAVGIVLLFIAHR